MVSSHNEWKILELDDKPQTNKINNIKYKTLILYKYVYGKSYGIMPKTEIYETLIHYEKKIQWYYNEYFYTSEEFSYIKLLSINELFITLHGKMNY